ncbi:MAG: alpha-N-arabinofuranosidase, partial [Ignavibacteria bacterium]|nr:alpha-N-arabinofuranosidase [Ignavibacteria bacterium]
VNVNPQQETEVECDLIGLNKISKGKGRIITAEKLNSFNTFDKSDNVVSSDYNNFDVTGTKVNIKIPSKSVVMIELN